jgi:uroporphyrinogen-III decarboxylase
MKKDAKILYKERLKRIKDAIALKEPDRVPLILTVQAFPMYTYGLTIKDAMYNYEKTEMIFNKFYEEYKPDLAWDPIDMYPAKVLEILGIKWFRWPGRGINDPNQMYQYIEDEYMRADEYDELIFDPTHFIQTKWIPRSFSALKGLRHLFMRESPWFGFFNTFHTFSLKEVQDSLKKLIEAAEEIDKWFKFLNYYDRKLEKMGFPIAYGGFGYAPFDMLGDTLRGTVPILQDICDRPEKLLQAVEKFLPIALESSIRAAKSTGRPFIWIWLHKGIDQFMSDSQFKKFYWATLQKYIYGLIDEGLTPVVYVEGSYNTRLEILREVPTGKVIYNFENTDMFRAKKILGDVACIAGNVSNSLLAFGSPQEVENYCKKLIDICGKGGGFIMDSAALIDNAKPENIKIMCNTVKEYGKYKK